MTRHARPFLIIVAAAVAAAVVSAAFAACAPVADEVAPTATATGSIDGTYRYTLTREHAEAWPPGFRTETSLATFPWVNTITLEDGVYQLSWQTADDSQTDPAGVFTVDGDVVAIDGFDDQGRPFHWELTFAVTADGDLVVTPSPAMSDDDAFVFTSQPWERIG